MPEYKPDPASQMKIDRLLGVVLEAGHGEVLIKVADHAIVSIEHKATTTIFRNERKKQPDR